MKKKMRLALAALSVVAVVGGFSPAGADVKSPGQCKKQGPSNCSGNSECAGPHYSRLPNGQQKKCD
jgi:hypothetical protein